MYYPNLLAEMAKKKVKQKDLCAVIDKEEQTVSKKMRTCGFTLEEGEKISAFLETDLPMNVLFLRMED